MKISHPSTPRKATRCNECGSIVRLEWSRDLPTPEGVVDLGFGVCACGSVNAAVEANPPDQPEGLLRYTLGVFMAGALAHYRAVSNAKHGPR